MKVLVVGGSGLIGGEIALYLRAKGHEVTIMARKPPSTPVLAELSFLQGDYVNDDCADGRLLGFDSLVFAAAADIRALPQDGSITAEDFYTKYNDEAVPRFFAAAKAAGINRAVYIGTFYPQVAPHRIGYCPYVTSRHNTDVAVRKLNSETFRVCSLNAPFVLGHIPGLEIPHVTALVHYVRGDLADLPLFAPVGGSNHISSYAIAQATANALVGGEGGKAYLLGGDNLSWKDYLQMWCAAVGQPRELEVRKDDHPMLPNAIMFAGAGATINYKPQGVDVLKYQPQDLRALMDKVVAAVR